MQAFTDSLRNRYVLERELGRGGMAVVYLALDLKHDRPVALKVMNPEAGMSQARSYGEAAAAAYAHVLEGWGQAGEREQVMILRAYGLAYAGRTNDAIAEAGRAIAFERQLGLRNAYLPFICARIYVLANRPEPAIDQLEETLRRRDFYSRGWLRIDGTFAPLRTNPRFQRLVASDPPS